MRKLKVSGTAIAYISLYASLAIALWTAHWLLQRTLEAPWPGREYLVAALLGEAVACVAMMLWEPARFTLAYLRGPKPGGLTRAERRDSLLQALGLKQPLGVWVVEAPKFKRRPAKLPTKLVRWPALEKAVEKAIKEAGEFADPAVIVTGAVRNAILALAVSAPATVALAILVHPLFLLLSAAPLVALFQPLAGLKSRASERGDAVSRELPFFTIVASVFQGIGKHLYDTLSSLAGSGVFAGLEREARLARVLVAQGVDKNAALDAVARGHPCKDFEELVLRYTAKDVSGGDTASYLADAAKAALDRVKFSWEGFVETAKGIAVAIIFLFVIFPVGILASSFMAPYEGVLLLEAVSFLAMPVISATLFFVASKAMPESGDIIFGTPLFGLALAFPAFGAALLASGKLWLAGAAALFAFGLGCGLVARLEVREIARTERYLPDLLRDIADEMKLGLDAATALSRVAARASYSPELDEILRRYLLSLERGEKVYFGARSGLARVVFFVLQKMAEAGRASPDAVEELRAFTTSVIEYKRRARATLKVYMAMVFLAPAMLAGTASIFKWMLSFVAAGFAFGGFAFSVPHALLDAICMLTVLASACASLLTAKVVSGTAKDALWVSLNVSLAVATLTALGIA